MAISFWH